VANLKRVKTYIILAKNLGEENRVTLPQNYEVIVEGGFLPKLKLRS